MEFFQSLVEMLDPKLLILIPVVWGIGLAVKASKCQNRFIPLFTLAGAVLVTALFVLGQNAITGVQAGFAAAFAIVTQGTVGWFIGWQTYDKIIKNGENMRAADGEQQGASEDEDA